MVTPVKWIPPSQTYGIEIDEGVCRFCLETEAVIECEDGYEYLEGDPNHTIKAEEVVNKSNCKGGKGAEEQPPHLSRNQVHVVTYLIAQEQQESEAGGERQAYRKAASSRNRQGPVPQTMG